MSATTQDQFVWATIDLLIFLSKPAHNTSRLKAFICLMDQRADQALEIVRGGRTYHIERGQALIAGSQLADLWDWDRKTVQAYLNGLQKLGYLSLSSVPYGQIITFHLCGRISPGKQDSKIPSIAADCHPHENEIQGPAGSIDEIDVSSDSETRDA